ncbi:MAG TPA: hypothetical protein VK745_09690 [Polyangiaceae bacterium]|jgi:hypothetical protein|nr:hypothetical protein [Polyangiaceae bacterium]
MRKVCLMVVSWALLVGCNPEFSSRFSDVDVVRVLGVQSSPAEGAPNTKIAYQILVATPTGTLLSPNVDWSYCNQPKPVSEGDDIAQACLGTGSAVMAIGRGAQVTGTIPQHACQQFGPDLPLGEPHARPTDADSTGGYYQPVIIQLDADSQAIPALAETRITCGLANSSIQQTQDYANRSHPNENPQLSDVVVLSRDNVSLTAEGSDSPLAVGSGEVVTLRASWPSCPDTPMCGDGICSPLETVQNCPADCTMPQGCRGPEPYAYLDPLQQAIVDRHEAMRVSWFASAGDFTDDHTGRLESEYMTTTSDDTWTAPTTLGPAFLWVVLRDDRGGVDWKSFQVQVQ